MKSKGRQFVLHGGAFHSLLRSRHCLVLFTVFLCLTFLYFTIDFGIGLGTIKGVFTPSLKHEHDHKGGVASQSAKCSKIGVQTLRKGGNAADAMIATTICLGVVDMWHTGLGGGGFMLIRSSNGSYESIDFRETAPAAASQDMFLGNANASKFGGLASGVPGELRGLQMLYQKHGSLPWADLILPAVRIARYGFLVTEDQAEAMDSLGTSSFLSQDPAWAVDFAPNGSRLVHGDRMTRSRYADFLELIAYEGPDVFYRGNVAEAIVSEVQRAGGIMTLDDLRKYTAIARYPIEISYRGYRIISCGAPSSGAIALNVMKVLETYADMDKPSTVNLSTHRLNEAMRFAYASRAKLGDPNFVDNMERYQQLLLSNATAKSIREKISDDHTLPLAAYDPDKLVGPDGAGTSHVVTADAAGLVVSMTSTINLAFGSHVMVPEIGLIMNNQMNDFSIPNSTDAFGYAPSISNYVKPCKRPLSSITPMIAEYLSNGTFYFVTGAAGGSHIISATLQVLWYALDWNKTPSEALAAPRFHDQLIPNKVQFEYEYDNRTADFIKAKGLSIEFMGEFSRAQAIRRLANGTFEVASDIKRLKSSGGFAT